MNLSIAPGESTFGPRRTRADLNKGSDGRAFRFGDWGGGGIGILNGTGDGMGVLRSSFLIPASSSRISRELDNADITTSFIIALKCLSDAVCRDC